MMLKVKMNTKELKFRVPIIMEPDSNNYFAHSPALPGLLMDGKTREQALQNAREGAAGLLLLRRNTRRADSKSAPTRGKIPAPSVGTQRVPAILMGFAHTPLGIAIRYLY